MAWVSVKENSFAEDSARTTDSRSATREFIAIANAPTSVVAAETASFGGVTIPVIGAGHPDDSTRKAVSIEPERDEESTQSNPKFIITVTYERSATGSDNPLSEPAEYQWNFSTTTEPVFRDVSDDEKPIVNSAGEPFENFVEREVSEPYVEITKNISNYNAAAAVAMMDKVNDNSFSIGGQTISEGTAKMSGITAKNNYTDSGAMYWTVTWVIKFREDWKTWIDDRGYNEIDPADSGKVREIVKGKPPTKPDRPWPLNGAGAALPNASDLPAELEFQTYKTISFPSY